MLLSENGTKRIIQLDKNLLEKVDNYRANVYNKYSSLSSEHISTTAGELIWCNYGSINVTLSSELLNSIVWHHNAPTVSYQTSLKIELPTSMTLSSGSYMYGPGTTLGHFTSNQSIKYTISYTTAAGAIQTVCSTIWYGLSGKLRDGKYFEVHLGILASKVNCTIWSDEFILPDFSLSVNNGRYAI